MDLNSVQERNPTSLSLVCCQNSIQAFRGRMLFDYQRLVKCLCVQFIDSNVIQTAPRFSQVHNCSD